MSEAISIILTAYLIGACSCSDLSIDEIGTTKVSTFSSKFERQKGKMKPVDGNIDSFIGRPIQSNLDLSVSCCFCENTQTFFDDDTIVAKAVADGEIVKVRTSEQTKVHGIVIVRHGSYITVYRNLDKIFVKEGDQVSLKSSIGEAGLSYSGPHKELLFDLYSNAQWLDP